MLKGDGKELAMDKGAMHRRARFLAAVFVALMLNHADAANFYVSSDGNDSNSGLSADEPFRTPARAISAMSNGDSVFFRAGDRFVLPAAINVPYSGTSGEHIVIGAYRLDGSAVAHRAENNRPILDGNKSAPSLKSYGGLVHVTGRYVEVRDLELRNSGGMGLRFFETSHGRTKNVKVDWTYHQGIQAYKSADIQIEECEVTGFGHGGKYYGESAFPNGVSVRSSTNVRVHGCVVHEGWGEGINSYYGNRDIVIEDNLVYAVRNVGIYVDSTHNAIVRNNIVLGTEDSLYHRYGNKPWVGPGIALNNESYQFNGSLSTSAIAKNVKIYNNLVAGTSIGLAFWGQHPATNWQDVVIANNTFVDNETQVSFTSTAYTNTRLANNIFLSISAGTSDWGGAIGQSGIHWQSNYWSQGAPSAAASSGDIDSGLALNKMSGWNRIKSYDQVSWQDFMPLGESKTIKAGTDVLLSLVSADFLGKARANPPDMGALESGNAKAGTRKPNAPGAFDARALN